VIDWRRDLDDALAVAQRQKKFVLIDFFNPH